MPNQQRHIAVLIYDQLCMFEFACVAEVFGLPRPEVGDNWYRFDTFSIDDQPVSCQYHGQMQPSANIDDLFKTGNYPDTIIIPGWTGTDIAPPPALIERLIAAHTNGSRLLSVCSGVFVLAATGLLDGKQATTHWRYLSLLQAQYPHIAITNDVLFVDNQTLLTSAGSAAGLDLCLHLVRTDFGSKIANTVARRLVLSPLREGSQAQFVEAPVPTHTRSSISAILEQMQQNLQDDQPVAKLAKSANMSERTFLRRFKASTGTTPNQWLTEARLQYAKSLLETTTMPIETLAEQAGFGTATTLRLQFRKRLKVSPMAYRKMFKQVSS